MHDPYTPESTMKIYLASSWRNEQQPEIVRLLRLDGHEVYDFKNPIESDNGFHWSEIDPEWQNWTPDEFSKALKHPVAQRGFGYDMRLASPLWPKRSPRTGMGCWGREENYGYLGSWRT
jgi:hypothetical protein